MLIVADLVAMLVNLGTNPHSEARDAHGVWCAVFGQQQQRTATTNAVQPVTIKTPDGAMAGTDSYAVDPYNGKDAVSNGGRLAPGDPSRRAFAYFMMGSARCVPHRWRRLCRDV